MVLESLCRKGMDAERCCAGQDLGAENEVFELQGVMGGSGRVR